MTVVPERGPRATLRKSHNRALVARALSSFIYAVLIGCVFGAETSQGSGIQDPAVPASRVERLVHINRPGERDSRYVYVPFDVPPGTARINISYQYGRENGANMIDIGLFDARSTGSEPEPKGFRGWSGGRRSEFFTSRDEATPGYLPGPMPAGRWRIILGLYQVAPAGVEVSLKIQIEADREGSPSSTSVPGKREVSANKSARVSATQYSPPIAKTAAQGIRWWSGDLHMHTVHSDGDWTTAELISSARNASLDFLVITDHNTASHHAEIDRLRKGSVQPLVLRGEEITTYGGHTNAWGLPSGTWVDFRSQPGDQTRISNIAAQVHSAGGLISINHPFGLCGGCGWSYGAALSAFDAIEVWNGAWDQTDEQALTMWDKILQSGRRITAIASSDSHRPANPIGRPATHVGSRDLSERSILSSIRQGRVYLTSEPKQLVTFEAEAMMGNPSSRVAIGDEIRLEAPGTVRFFITTEAAPPDATISMISSGHVIRSLPGTDVQPQMIEIECQNDSYFRLELRDKMKELLALTNPIFVRIGRNR